MQQRERRFYFGLIVLASLYYIIYCNSVMVELPYLTWLDQMPIIDTYYSGELSFRDLLTRYGEHGMLANNILFLINVVMFHGSTLFDVYINDINVIVCGILITYETAKSLKESKTKFLIITGEVMILFSAVQGSSGAMETQVRLGLMFFLIAMVFVDDCLRNNQVDSIKLVITLLIIFFSINVFGTLYSFAGIPMVWGAVFFTWLKQKKINKNLICISVAYFMTIPLYIVEYQIGGIFNGSGGSGNCEENIRYFFVNPINSLQSFCSFFANGALGWAFHERVGYDQAQWLVLGAVIFGLTIFSIIMFFVCHLYTKTWLPLMGIVYAYGVLLMVFIGRSSTWEWYSNEWYNVHIKFALVGVIWILGLVAQKKTLIHKIILYAFAGYIVVLVYIGNVYTLRRAPHVRAYYEAKQEYLFYYDNMPQDENGNTPLLNTYDVTIRGVNILKKYNLSVYRYWDIYVDSLE